MVVSGYGGLDELTTTGPNRVSHFHDGKVESYELDPTHYNLKPAHISELLGGDPSENARILRGVLSGEVNSAKRDVVLLNAGAALVAAARRRTSARASSWPDVIESGVAQAGRAIAYTQRVAHVQ